MADDRAYWPGARARLIPAVLVGLVPALLLLWMGEGTTAAVLVGIATLLSVVLVPPPRKDAERS